MINILAPDEAKKIAAGEVIDRPAALVRELLDNALDAGAVNIELSIAEGGIKKIELIDDGCGMSKEDLTLCIMPHATSKIQSVDDLSRFTTLGFRGEALAAAAAVARLEIVTSADGREAWLLETAQQEVASASAAIACNPTITQSRRTRGASVRAFGLFDAIPARKRFLKRESSEAALCRQIFIEKALAFPGVSFRFVQDGILKLQSLGDVSSAANEKTSSLQKRFGSLILAPHERSFLHTVETSGNGFTVTIVFGGPELYRKDRRQQYIFANKRRIQDFGLMQALEFGLAGFFPNGTHPLGAVFVEVDPALADFNIHPAKREVRFADAGAIHHSITSALRNYTGTDTGAHGLRSNTNNYEFDYKRSSDRYTQNNMSNSLAMKALLDRQDGFIPPPRQKEIKTEYAAEKETIYDTHCSGIRFIGRAFDLFIIIEKEDKIYLIDQHAAHERLLYDDFLSGPVPSQELLVPVPFNTGSGEEDRFLESKKDELSRLGIILENEGGGSWRIDALPAGWKTGDGETVEAILALQKTKKNLAEHWIAALACRTAIKDGNYLDDTAALALAESVLALFDKTGQLPRCPHGRPLWTEISREDLFRAVRRTE